MEDYSVVLKYEHDVYAEAIDAMPVVGALVKVDDLKGKVIEVNPLLEQVRIEFNDKTIKICQKMKLKFYMNLKNVVDVD